LKAIMENAVLVLNAGSSSIKLTVFAPDLSVFLTGMADRIGGAGTLRLGDMRQSVDLPDHATALRHIFTALAAQGVDFGKLAAVGHRVVHGGPDLTRPQAITPALRAEIAACIPLAPLHNPHNLAAIDAVAQIAPTLPQFACFDTGFHATNPAVATHYALPPDYAARGLRRYGFHGLSYASLMRNYTPLTGQPVPARVLACHLGNGASLCAIRQGQSVATTMGYSPLEGLTMGTRAGSIDANLVLRLAAEEGLEATHTLLNHRSGLLGLSGHSADMRPLGEDGSNDSAFAMAHFCYWAARHAGSMVAAMGGLDAIVFTGGIGENAANIRAGILGHLGWLGLALDPQANAQNAPRLHQTDSAVQIWIIPADEEREIAHHVRALMRA
jgi:acetate kinase